MINQKTHILDPSQSSYDEASNSVFSHSGKYLSLMPHLEQFAFVFVHCA